MNQEVVLILHTVEFDCMELFQQSIKQVPHGIDCKMNLTFSCQLRAEIKPKQS